MAPHSGFWETLRGEEPLKGVQKGGVDPQFSSTPGMCNPKGENILDIKICKSFNTNYL